IANRGTVGRHHSARGRSRRHGREHGAAPGQYEDSRSGCSQMNRGSSYNAGSRSAVPDGIARLIGVAILVFVLIVFGASGTYVVQPGFRGIAVTLGKVSPQFK